MRIKPSRERGTVLLLIVLGLVVLAVGGCAAYYMIRTIHRHLGESNTNDPPVVIIVDPTNEPSHQQIWGGITNQFPGVTNTIPTSEVRFEWSTNLIDWEPISVRVTTDANGITYIDDTNETYSPIGFYRPAIIRH